MATVGTFLSLADGYKRQESTMKQAQIIEILDQMLPILQDAPAIEANNGTFNRTTMRSTLPDVGWRQINEGIEDSKSGTSQFDDTTGLLEAFAQVDTELVRIQPNPGQFRLDESTSFFEAMSQEAATGMFYHDTKTDPERILGLATRFNSTTAENGSQVLLGGGSGSDNASIWMIVWGPRTAHLIFPKGTAGGLTHEDLGVETVLDASGNKFRAFIDHYVWRLGIAVPNWRYVVRIANIDTSDLTEDASAGANLMRLLIQGYWQLAQRRDARGNAAIYCNATVLRFLDNQVREGNSNTHLTWRETGVDSEPVLHFRNMPIREVDALTDAEATVS